LTPGTYVYTWNSSPAQDDSLTVKIGSIPEPATWAMMLLGFAALGFAGFRATRRSGRARHEDPIDLRERPRSGGLSHLTGFAVRHSYF
jgi:hypothetical protein